MSKIQCVAFSIGYLFWSHGMEQEKLGTMLDKMTRVENMVTKLSCIMDINEDLQQIIREAASLAMSDLATSVVTEFTALSGVMGRHYALRDGYSEQVVLFAMSDLATSVFMILAVVVPLPIWLLTTHYLAIFFFFSVTSNLADCRSLV